MVTAFLAMACIIISNAIGRKLGFVVTTNLDAFE
jgi:hypothetical protein